MNFLDNKNYEVNAGYFNSLVNLKNEGIPGSNNWNNSNNNDATPFMVSIVSWPLVNQTYGDFWAYFHSGDNIHLTFPPFQVFNKHQFWVGDIWLEDIIYIFILGFLGGITLLKQKLHLLAFFVLTYLAAASLVAHRDISRYLLPVAPFILIAFEKVLTSREFKIILPILLLAIYLYAQNFLLTNIAPIPNLPLFN